MNAIVTLLSEIASPSLWLSLQSAVLGGALLLLSRLLRGHISARWIAAFWLVLCLRLALPWSLPLPIAMPFTAQMQSPGGIQQTDALTVTPTLALNVLGEGFPAKSEIGDASIGVWSSIAPWVLPGLFALWLAVFFAMALATLTTNIRFARALKRGHPIDLRTLDPAFETFVKVFRLARPPLVLETKLVQSPALFGLLRPAILLPEGFTRNADPGALRHVLAHEFAHIKRNDMPLFAFMSFLRCVHWFNPVVWLAFARMRADVEMACDEIALTHLSPADRTSYGHTLLSLAQTRYAAPRLNLAAWSGTRKVLAERVHAIMVQRKPDRRAQIFSAILLIALGGVSMSRFADAGATTNLSAAPPASDAKPANEQDLSAALSQLIRVEFEDIHVLDVLEFLDDTIGHGTIAVAMEQIATKEDGFVADSGVVTDGIVDRLQLNNIPIRFALEALLRPLNLGYAPTKPGTILVRHEQMLRGTDYLFSQRESPTPERLAAIRETAEDLDAIVSAEFSNISLDKIFAFISDTWDVNLVLDTRAKPTTQPNRAPRPDAVPSIIVQQCQLVDVPLRSVLEELLQPLGLDFRVEPGFIWVSSEALIAREY